MPYNHNTHETYLIDPMSVIAISSLDFLFLSCLHVRLRNALLNITKYISSTGISGILEDFGLFFEMCLIDLAAKNRNTKTWIHQNKALDR